MLMNCNFETSTVFCADRTMGTCRRSTNGYANNLIRELHLWNLHSFLRCLTIGARHNDGHVKPRPRNAPCGISTGNTTSGSGTATGDVHSFLHVETREQVLHHNGQDNLIHRLAPVVIQRRACIDGRRTATAAPHSFLHVRTRTPVQHHNRHVIRVQGLQLWDLHGLHCLDHNKGHGHNLVQESDLENLSGMLHSLPCAASVSRSALSQLGRPLAPLDNGRGMCKRDRGCGRHILQTGAGGTCSITTEGNFKTGAVTNIGMCGFCGQRRSDLDNLRHFPQGSPSGLFQHIAQYLYTAPGPRRYPALQRGGPGELPRAHRRYVHR